MLRLAFSKETEESVGCVSRNASSFCAAVSIFKPDRSALVRLAFLKVTMLGLFAILVRNLAWLRLAFSRLARSKSMRASSAWVKVRVRVLVGVRMGVRVRVGVGVKVGLGLGLRLP